MFAGIQNSSEDYIPFPIIIEKLWTIAAIQIIIVNYKYKLTLSTHGRRGFLTSPMQSVQVISKSTIYMLLSINQLLI